MAKKKTLLIIPIVMIMTILISALTPICAYADNDSYEPRLTAPSSSSPYYSRKLNVYFQTGTPMPNCVAYAYGRIYELNGEAPKITHGSAGDWYGMNKRAGYYDYGSEPEVGVKNFTATFTPMRINQQAIKRLTRHIKKMLLFRLNPTTM